MYAIFKTISKKFTVAFVFLIVLTIVNTSILTGNTFLEGMLLNSLVYKGGQSLFFFLLVAIIGIGIVRLIVSFFVSRIQILTSQRAVFAINEIIIRLLFNKKTLSITSWEPTTLSTRISDDVNIVVSFFCITIIKLVSVIVSLLSISFFVIKMRPNFFLIMIVFVPIYLIVYFIFKKNIFNVNISIKNAQNNYFSSKNNFISRYIEIKGKGNYQIERERLGFSENQLYKFLSQSFRINYQLSTSQILIQLVFQLSFFIVGGLSVLNGNTTIGFFSIVSQYFNQILTDVDTLLGIGLESESYHASMHRLRFLLDVPTDKNGKDYIHSIDSIEVLNFNINSLSRPSNENQNHSLLKSDFSATFVGPGLYTIVGGNGVGKSTLIRTITGIYQPDYIGKILINGHKISDIDMLSLRKNKMGFVFQDIPVPHLKVIEYISDSLKVKQSKYIQQSEIYCRVFHSRKFDIDDFLDKRMDRLSSGELQLIRLFVSIGAKKDTTYFLDEPTANIQPELRTDVIALLKKIAQEALVIVVTHDEALSRAGKIVKIS